MKANFKIRCSAIGQIMTSARAKNETLSQIAKTYLEAWAKGQIYGRRQEIKSKYMDKGIQVETPAIELINKHLFPSDLMIKNDLYFEDDHMTGIPDVILKDSIIDVKSSWDCFTFPLFEADLPEKNYYWQMQGYMALTDKRKASVIYALMDTPDEIVERELRSHFWGSDEWDTDEENLIREKHMYHNVPIKYRLKRFDIYRSDEDIQAIRDKVEECRNYLKEL